MTMAFPIVTLAENLVRRLEAEAVRARVFGGVAIVKRALWEAYLGRPRITSDIDVVIAHADVRDVIRNLKSVGLEVTSRALMVGEGAFVSSEYGSVKVDIFADPLRLNQTIHIGERMGAQSFSLAAPELLLTKFQIKFPKETDCIDAALLVLDIDKCSTGVTHDGKWDQIIRACADDWCLDQACRDAIERLQQGKLGLPEKLSYGLAAASENLLKRLLTSPKTHRWKLRSIQGRLLPTYTPVDDP